MSQRQSNFQRASDGSMTLIEHIRELRTRLTKSVLAVLVGFIVASIMQAIFQFSTMAGK